MASTRVINCISYKRLVAVSSLKNVYILSNFSINSNFRQNALYCTKKSIAKTDYVEHENKIQVGFADVVKENTKSIGYLGVIIGGIGITAFMFYMIFDELFSNKSPNSVYSKALDRCIKHPKVTDALGEPIKAYGEESRRGRRSHISHIVFEKDGVRHMRMKFYIQGIRRRATVNLEVQEDESGNYMYRYLYVLVDDILQTIIKIEDNREQKRSSSTEAELEWN
ncbi:mitochondrial import inner membrane translocase subunit Tim21 [Bombus bifarius]|uniref:Mitochondrial import inner membrane translocase subunit Tim21 n=1 Tax=Bombus bifarius TaxID=103933 RepID=A0A6P8LL34_9HYME|nr:mitochondrial import inner membrane translocase subunit Tim21 [Bombus vancouverensis nearcticus]XP_033187746.1 mitochondrial import inner membrane translocase subunit Tim21 [Bombus vancouverensis nearcticus]XP_033187754.1 mitochondrial import inner membrane translocase subunit Tim21 [Bombus vancouverensis nearcticus]XP_033187763.1 mitochondrial import inner membrane translocase subunit Tim21 [Bombus vancouverensis nearcticus]XP_033187772.1 mitochondrial import inner membrane translocase subu